MESILVGGLAREIRQRFDPALLIVSPPRSGSTALARAFWQHPAFRWYVHEPFDRVYHHGGGEESVLTAVRDPIDVGGHGVGGLIIKEMTFQVGSYAGELVALASLPIVVALRDPRLAVESRMRQRRHAGQEPSFPHNESGWCDLVEMLDHLHASQVRHVLVETTRLRARPAHCLEVLCARLGIGYMPDMLSWPAAGDMHLGQLASEQTSWYERVLRSSGFEPPTEVVPGLDEFPPGMRAHVAECLEVYQALLTDSEMLRS
jgi:hypothetical protein